MFSKILFRRQIKLSKAGASINVYNLRNCSINHFLQLPLENEKLLKTVGYDQDEDQLAANSNYADVQETCLQSLLAKLLPSQKLRCFPQFIQANSTEGN